ncbi:mucin-binding protein [Streptococcus thermophilus]|uniref:mucin-binding protein n=8 Tax=Streptococcus thermophilus TaxID=1308 RepID=UPI0015C284BD|nr:YSIRK-type signal peptide-containing protein [Streptococcus thermophilus]CAD0143548.1 conserved exported protein of unknown function [Streptococcus thermophilus]
MRGKQQDFRTEKYIRYGIRKFSFGAASVAIAVGLMFLGNGVVSATEVQSAETAITTSASSQGDKETEKAEPKAETVETVKPETVSPETIKPETVKPETVNPETVNSETMKPETVNPETVNSKTVNPETVNSETVKPETVNPETVNSETVKPETVKPETVNPETEKATEVKSEVAATKAATKATLANTDASQADVDAQAETVSALSTAVTESNTAEKKLRPTEIYTTNGTPGTAGTAVKTNAKYENSVETVDNNKRGNRENTHSINQRRIVKRSPIVTTEFAQNYGRKVLSGSVTYPGFSVSDPDYPSGMWIDPDKSHYSYEWVQTYHGNQIVLSTNRTGDGIVYVTELSPSNKVLNQYTLNQNTQVQSAKFYSTTYYNDTYYAMVESLIDPLAVKYIASKYDTGYYNKLSYMVPKLITQTTYFVDKDGKQITDSNGNPVVPYTQKGLVGQKYTTSPILINGYYATAPSNSKGVMSPFGKIGVSYVKDFHDGIVVTYTQTGSDGTMSASIAQNGKVRKTYTNIKPSDPVIKYQVGYTTVAIKNPYIPQTSDVKYVYNKLGNWIVSNPDGSKTSIIYPNDPSDPTKIADSSVPGYPVIDFLPGYTPKDHMGTPLVPVDPDDRTKGYIPPIPSDIGKDTTITYTADTQKATVTYVVEGTGTVLHTDNLEGKSGEPIDYSTVAKLAELKALGYDLVTDGFTTATDKNFDKDTKVDQSFVVTVKPHVEPIKPVDPENPNDPNKPKPGDPIDPNNPDGPKWTEDLIKQIDTTRHVNRTITSVNEKGEEVAQKVTDKVTFTREGKINSVTGEITYGNWTAKDGDTTFDKVESPVVQGYILKDAKQKEVAATTGLTVDSKDENIEVVYTKLGSWVPKVPEGFEEPKLDKPQYPNDPTDPTKPGTPTTVIPQVPGTTPKDSNGNPLKPVDPNDPSKGYVPPTPENPTEDTVITYEKDSQKATVTYVVEGTGTVLHTDNLEGKSGEPIDYSTVAKLAELKALGYDLVTDGFTTATDKNFDKDTKVDQSFVVTVKPHVEPIKPVDPENPNDPNKPKPGDPIDPNNPDGPKWTEDLIKQIDTTRHVNRTITSVNEKGEEVAQKVTDKVTFTREGKINSVTGEITYGNWTAKDGDTTFDKVESPVVQGYILKDAKQKEVAATTGLTVDSKDENIEVVYTKLGSWVPKVPEGFEEPKLDKPQYPNDPTDPTKPGTPTTVIPQVPGTTPKDSNGNPLKPVDPNDPSKGYVPPTPENPTEDTVITYEKDSQKATVTYVVEGTGTVLHTDNLEGKSGEPIDYSTVAKLAELKALGYDLVTDGFTTATDKNFDKDTKVDQSFVVTVKPHVEPIKPVDPENPNDPNKPKPGDPIDPNNPDGPKWTEDLIKQIDTTRHVNRTITSVNEKGEEVAQKVTDKVTFTREGKINSVTGEITYGNWTAKDGDTTFDKVESPVVQGYILKDAKQKEVAATTGLTVDSKDENIEVVYTKLGSWVPKVPEGFEEPKLDKPQYPNDPTDPTKPGTPTTVIPQVPGTTPKDSNGNPLKPVDPNDPSKGYVPPTPENPTEDTVITYEKDSQKATVTYVVEGTGTVLHTDNLEGKSGEPIDYSTVAKLAELKALGYDLVTDGFTTATDKNFDKDTKVDQSFVVTVKPHVEPIKPVDPENPNDPNKPKPGDPIDPNNPDGPKWTEDLIKQIDTTRHVNRTITSVNEKGEEVAQKVTDKVTFTREGKINSVTGEITYGNWTAKDGDTTFDKVESPVVQGYILKDAKQKEVAATTGLTVDSKDENIEVVYTKLGSWVPKVPEGFEEPKLDKPQYPNDPTDPTKPGTPTTVIPQVPGTTPKDSNGNPLKPVDPNDPSKGYVPPTPENPTEDTVITYEKDSQKATVTYVVEGTGTVLHTDNLEGKSGEPIDYSTVAKLAELKALGYDLVTDGFTTATDKNFDKDTKVDQSFVVTVKPHVEPIKPVDPENPNDPNKPKPGDPIDPNNPDGPKWTEDLIKQIDTTRHVNRTITSVNEKGEEVAQKVTDKVTFTREGKINSVTGEITYGNWTAKDGDTTFDKVESPVVQGYILKDAKQKEVAATTGLTVDSKDENIEVVYTKLGSWVPKVPEGFEEPKLDKPQYPNDPTDPTKPGTPTTVIPQVPGTTPKDSNGNPLKPVDPNDPSKGYVPPTPENPTEDTVITYEKDSQKATVTYVVEGTGTVLHTDNLEGKSGEPIDYSTVAKLAELKALGYDLVTDGFTTATDKNFDKDTKVDQSFVVTVKPHVEPIKPVDPENPNDPNKPKPGDPIDPNNPDGPKWTEDLIKQIDTTRHVNRTITSVNEKGEEVAQKVTDKVTFTREGKINSVTGEITYGNWTAKDGDTTFDKVESPVVQGYILKDAKQKEVAATTGLTVDSKDENIEVVYTKLGSWVPKVPEGFEEPKLDKPQYPNDPTDPTKPGTPTTVIPQVPGTTPKDSNGNPLKPVDPNDPSKGYVPPTPENPTEDTVITYEKDSQKATVTYVVEGTGTVLHTDNLEGKSGEPIDYSTVAKLAELKALGYDLVTDGFTTATDKNFDKDTKVDQSFVVTVKPHVEPIKPVDPENPNDPNKPKPGDPIDPNNPDGPKWTEDLIKQIDTTRHVNRTITSVNEKGEEVAQKVTDKVTFTREGKINSVTGEITYGNWTAKDGDTTFDKVESPVVQGYILKDAKQKEVAATTGLTVDSKDENIEVVYTKLGSWVPKVPEGFEEPKLDKPQYPNDPTDPTKPGTPTTVIPQVPGTTPKDSNGNPLKPVDPNDPSKGYVPPTPENPTEDTVITYEKDSQKATVTYVVEGTGTVLHTDNLEGKSGEPIDYSTVAKLAELKALGYDLVTDGFTTATDKNFDKDTKVDQSFVVTVKPHVEPIKPVDPENPNDPNKPKPGDPIDPNNPDGPKWTEDLIKQIDTTRHVNRTITSVNEKGEEVAQKVTDKVTFTREGKINSVTGEITYGNWTAKDGDTTFDKVESPVVQGYILKDAKQKEVAATTGLTVDSKDENIEVVYTKLGSWVPKVPEGFEEPKLDKPQYPNDPTDPTKPGTPTTVIPQVPGTTPKDSNGNPLKPVDPNDPSKGYVPPTPENPTEDTVITYEKDSQKATVTYVVEGTGTVLHTDNLEGKSGEPIDYSTVAKLAELKALGYDLVTDGFTTATDKNFDKDTKVDQSFVVTVKPHVEPIKPVDPENPNDPNKPKPGDPIDPNNPDGPKWTEDLIKQIDTTRHVNRTITSVNEKGEEVAQKVTDKVTFTREGKINSVTGEITYGNWTAKDGDTTFDKVESPVVQGYILKDAKQKEVAATTGLTVDSKDENIEVVYTKLGSWVPKVPEGFEEPKLDKPQYPNDPTDPTKPGTPTTVIPQVPGTTPKDSNGNPLKPVDPNDPSKGYVPPTPENPTEDTPINYVPVPQPVRPTDNGDNNGTPTTAAQPASPSTPQYMDGKRELPNTGTEDNASLAALGLLGVLSGFGLVARKKKED